MASIKKTAGLTTMYYASSVLLRTTGEDEKEGERHRNNSVALAA